MCLAISPIDRTCSEGFHSNCSPHSGSIACTKLSDNRFTVLPMLTQFPSVSTDMLTVRMSDLTIKSRRRVRQPRESQAARNFRLPFMLCSPVASSRISQAAPSTRRSPMPRYEFLCHACKKTFLKILALVDYDEGEVRCPHCGSKEVEQY